MSPSASKPMTGSEKSPRMNVGLFLRELPEGHQPGHERLVLGDEGEPAAPHVVDAAVPHMTDDGRRPVD